MITRKISKTPTMPIPRSLKGNSKSQAIGYSMTKNRARGQDNANKMAHNRQPTTFFTPLLILPRT